jgi:hypothetical protein
VRPLLLLTLASALACQGSSPPATSTDGPPVVPADATDTAVDAAADAAADTAADAAADTAADTSPTAPDVPSGPSPEAACADHASILCEQLGRCDRGQLLDVHGDAEMCRRRTRLRCLATITSPGSSWTAADQAACTGALSALDCAGVTGATPAACKPRPGTLAEGSSCALDVQCQGLLCKPGRGGCGVCATVSPVGGPCQFFSDCEDRLPCLGGVCAPLRKVNEPCDGFRRCEPALACIGGNRGMGVCQKARGLGEPCDAASIECAEHPDRLVCVYASDPMKGTCQRVSSAGAGEACGDLGPGPDISCRGSTTCSSILGGPGVCIPLIADGAPCDPTLPSCLPHSICAAGFCRPIDGAFCQ